MPIKAVGSPLRILGTSWRGSPRLRCPGRSSGATGQAVLRGRGPRDLPGSSGRSQRLELAQEVTHLVPTDEGLARHDRELYRVRVPIPGSIQY